MKNLKTKRLTIDEIINTKIQIPRSLLSRIKGGTAAGDAFLNTIYAGIFDFTAPNLSADMISTFKSEIADFATTKMGQDFFSNLLANNVKVVVTGDLPGNSAASAHYETGTHKMAIGALGSINTSDAITNSGNNAMDFTAITHELYHAYEEQVEQKSPAQMDDSQAEVDASIFSYMADYAYDMQNNKAFDSSDSHMRLGGGELAVISNANPTPLQLAYKSAWDDIFQTGTVTVADYNILVNNFNTTSAHVSIQTAVCYGEVDHLIPGQTDQGNVLTLGLQQVLY